MGVMVWNILCTQELGALAISVAVDAAAPKIIVPVSSSIDKGFLLLDTGKIFDIAKTAFVILGDFDVYSRWVG